MNYDNMTIDSKTAMIGDIHGCQKLLLELLENLENKGIEKFLYLFIYYNFD